MINLSLIPLAIIIAILIGITAYSIGLSKAKKYDAFHDAEMEAQRQSLLSDINLLSEQKTTILSDMARYRNEFEEERVRNRLYLEEYIAEKRQLIDQQIASEFELSREKLKQNIAEITRLENKRLEESLQKNREDFEAKSLELKSEIDIYVADLNQIRRKRAAAIEDAKRQEEMKTQSEFYRLQISTEDLDDICELKQVEKKLSKKEVLNKLIYKVYFEKSYTDLIGRVVGKETKTGIYKITNTLNQKVYIGQAVNIAERWKQHIKRALGAEPLTQNKLYPAMQKDGVWNFTFEIVEICEKSQLNEREQYWQQFFGAKEYGYSIK
jgi:outer membrane murein-binding lipoprotein Lpp